jgi:hypothetical protein
MPNTPYMNIETEKAPEVTPRSQTKAVDIGVKKTPKELYVAQDIVIIKKAAITTT